MAIQGTVIHRPWTRTAGAALLVAAGAALVKLCVLDVLADARAHADRVSLSFKGVLVAPALLVFGVVVLYKALRGEAATGPLQRKMTNPQTQRLNAFGWVVVFLFLVPGAGLYLWLRAQLVSLGYDV